MKENSIVFITSLEAYSKIYRGPSLVWKPLGLGKNELHSQVTLLAGLTSKSGHIRQVTLLAGLIPKTDPIVPVNLLFNTP